MNAMNGLTHTEIINLKRKLEKEDSRVRDNLHEEFLQRSAGNESEGVQHHDSADDDAVVDVLNDAAVSDMTRATASLEAIDASLNAMQAGTYGVCQDCDRHIGVKRLNANPTASCCTPCQSRREKNTPHPSL